MMKGKRLIVFLVAVSMMLVSMFSGLPVSAAAETEADTVFAEAELMGKKTCTIKKKKSRYYYVNAKGRTTKKKGWQKNAGGDYAYYIGEKGNVTAKITKGKYYKSKSGGFVLAALSGRATTAKLNNRYFYVNTNGKIVTSTGWKKNASGAYAYYVSANGSVTAKLSGGGYFRYASGKFTKKSLAAYKGQTIKIHGLSVIVSEDGTASVVEKTHAADENNNSGDNNNNQSEEHVHQWSFKDENGNILEDTNYVQHPEEYHYEDVITVPAHKEPVWEERYVCLWEDCGAQFTCDDEGLELLTDHAIETGHGSHTLKEVVVDYNYYDDVWGEEKVVDKEAWSEWDQNYRCTVCGDTMKIHASSESGSVIHTPEKSGDVLNFYGKVSRTVTAGVPY